MRKRLNTEATNLLKVEGVKILNFGSGHSWGMLGLLVELPKTGNIIIAADSIYTSENMGPPVQVPGIIYDSLGYISTVKNITRLAKEKKHKFGLGMI